MALTRSTGKHRAPSRTSRRNVRAASAAALATSGVLGTLASPAFAADAEHAPPEDTGLNRVLTGCELADEVEEQAVAQELAAEAAERQAGVEAAAERQAEIRVRAAREAERRRLTSFQLPVAGSYVSTAYRASGSMWSSGSHSGVDFHAPYGSVVVSVGLGTVVEAGWGGAYGNNVVIRMEDGTYTQYGHLASIGVFVGERVVPGQQIGVSGSTGNSTGPHLHFEARTSAEYGSDVDPVSYLRARGVSL
ncbi:M23 family metallopeptidase [Streptomyces somaliensis]|uniref:M23 family metallopeptidase n=1 Tax=Streptomyces somaliensis TaxID=78355 RepID=UPI0020CBC795|nr:M23 family metallopeptidase [Streptomyces somaliensis]MCP9943963.1 M23 family metallopeptidase [Streptomyces somaliensis]MCP9962797.1 M23 family metallopeptidase [Streptomyces somaliensis]MCP9975635.1 M23 family metallopeptidase [Streptomyces somaliensis]